MLQSLLKNSYLRRMLWRIGRRLYAQARRDTGNDPRTNGEYWLIESIARLNRNRQIMTLMDVGANTGEWTHTAVTLLSLAEIKCQIHAFEPTKTTYSHLRNRFSTVCNIIINHVALSDRNGKAKFHITGELAGTNSLHGTDSQTIETVELITLDIYLENCLLTNIDVVKCDTEGHDMSVLRGAEKAMREGRIGIWQFEYNHRWIANRAFLKDVFDWIADKPYRLGKLFNGGVELFEYWHPELERYFEANYVLIHKEHELNILAVRKQFNSCNVLDQVR